MLTIGNSNNIRVKSHKTQSFQKKLLFNKKNLKLSGLDHDQISFKSYKVDEAESVNNTSLKSCIELEYKTEKSNLFYHLPFL